MKHNHKEAHAEGYVRQTGKGPHPFHGYYFRILTRQGQAAPGGRMDYLLHGNLTEGFALVAYPENWDQSGIIPLSSIRTAKCFSATWAKRLRGLRGDEGIQSGR